MWKLGIIGAGAWGSALAKAFELNFETIQLYTRQQHVVDSINNHHSNPDFLVKTIFANNVFATNNVVDLKDCNIVLITTPVPHIRKLLTELKSHNITNNLLICSKGIEISSKKLITQIMEELGYNMDNVGILTGPSFASEVINKSPTTLLLATKNLILAKTLSSYLQTPNLRLYYSDDMIGAQIGGALKNIIAIATGIIRGMNLGDNALSALITRGLAEMINFTTALGGRKDTLYGISGLGDLILTATNLQSRNFTLGYKIGELGHFHFDMLNQLHGTSEGYHSVKAVYEIAKDNNIAMPICNEVYKICYEKKSPNNSILELMNRSFKEEC